MFLKRAIFSLLCIMTLGCRPAKKDTSEAQGLYQATGLWPDARASVCFADHAQGNAEIRKITQTIIEKGINQRTAFHFNGFKLCSQDSKAQLEVRIEIKGRANAGDIGDTRNELFKTLSHFVPANRLRNPMTLTYRSSDGTPKSWHNMVLHEFGHALGLHHEQLRSDNKNGKLCSDSGGGVLGDQPEGSKKVGSFDMESIMNYCNPKYFEQDVDLSKGDIATINRMYASRNAEPKVKSELRCDKNSLVNCIRGNGGATCAENSCNGGEYLCKNSSKLRECLKFGGGLSCLGAADGQCQG